MANNAGLEGSVVVNEVKTRAKGIGLNIATGEYEDMVKAGIIDPAMVTRSALQNAASIAKNILTTECIGAGKRRGARGARAAELGLPEIGIADHFALERRRGRTSTWCRSAWTSTATGCAPWRTARRHPRAAGSRGRLRARARGAPARRARRGTTSTTSSAACTPWPASSSTTPACATTRWGDADALFARYYDTVRRAAASGCFDVLAHLDYIGLWGHRPGPAALRELDEVLDALAASGTALELNTDWRSDPAGVMYPSPEILRAAQRRGIPLVIDSDAHEAEHVGRLFGEAMRSRARPATARRCGSRTGARAAADEGWPGGPPLPRRQSPPP